eukprot:g14466.t1
MMQVPLQYVVAGVATAFRLQPTSAFIVPSPTVPFPSLATLADDLSSRASRRLPPHPQSLISSWLVGGEDRRPESSIQILTQTLHAPLESFENMRQAAETLEQEQDHDVATAVVAGAANAAGLLCLERSLPAEVLHGLEHLTNVTAPFKAEVFRAGVGLGVNNANNEDELDSLTADFGKIRSRSASTLNGAALDLRLCDQEFSPPDQAEEAQFLENSRQRRNWRTAERVDSFALMPQRQLADEAPEAVRWLTADIKRVASLFAREASALSVAGISSLGDGKVGAVEGGRAGVTVKLELLNKGKCPRFHLDKVPIRLICTYVGPSTVWLDGYDRHEMERNRSPPPACNLKISGGRETRHARPGDVLIFRGQPEGGPTKDGAFGVAHRSPDTVKGQRRLVLTMDVGDLNGLAAAAHPASYLSRRVNT